MLKIITWLWNDQKESRTKYTAHHVNIWAAMVSRHLTIPHTLACVTDTPEGIDSHIEIIKPPGEFVGLETPTWNKDKPNCFRRLVLFSPNAEDIFGAKRFVSMDLDCVIGANIDSLFDREDDIVLYKGTSFDRPYNGSMLLMNAGSRPQVYLDFNEENAIKSGQKYIGSDQAWIAYCLGSGEKTWSFEDGIAWWGSQYNPLIKEKKILFFPGTIKPWEVVTYGLDPWCTEHYKGEKTGKCLILGYNKNVWEELEAVLDQGPFDDFILSPEVLSHWENKYLDVAANDKQSILLAKMHGYKDFVFVGVSK